jgi:hypothetical protein
MVPDPRKLGKADFCCGFDPGCWVDPNIGGGGGAAGGGGSAGVAGGLGKRKLITLTPRMLAALLRSHLFRKLFFAVVLPKGVGLQH